MFGNERKTYKVRSMTRSRSNPPPPVARRHSTTVRIERNPPPPGTSHASHAPTTPPPSSQTSTTNGAHPMSERPSMMHQVATIAAGSAIGHVAGAGISNMMFGGRNHRDEPAVATAPNPVKPVSVACMQEHLALNKCMDENNGNISVCQWYVDTLKQCHLAKE